MKKVFISLLLLSGIFILLHIKPVPAKDRGGGIFEKSNYCGQCHQEIYKNWKNSLHALSFQDPIFYTAYLEAMKISPEKAKKTCLRCHAPVAFLQNDFDLKMDNSREGVSCDFCHRIKNVNLTSNSPFSITTDNTKFGPFKNRKSPAHKTSYSPLHQSSMLCAGCHEYRNSKGVHILSTFSEWKESYYAINNIHCQECHMPAIRGKIVSEKVKAVPEETINLHEVSGGHSIDQLKKALKVEIADVQRDRDNLIVRVRLSNVGSGHKVPTGIPTRKLILAFEAKTPKSIIYREERTYQKILVNSKNEIIEHDADVFLTSEKIFSDNRISPKEERIETFTFSAPDREKINLSAKLYYLYQPYVLERINMKIDFTSDEKIVK